MRSLRVLPQDYWWRQARKAECYEPHAPTAMSSACSTPPIRLWVCGLCGAAQHTTSARTPVCSGGYAFSFQTHAIDDADAP